MTMQETSNLTSTKTVVPSLDPAVEVGTVTLKVADLARSIKFYTEVIGLEVFKKDDHSAVLGAGNRSIVLLEEVPGATRLARNVTGLYHAAILFPTRHSLAIKVQQLLRVNYPFGYGDHLVSEAFYLDDPDANGLELYADRPRSTWKWDNGKVQMASDPIDFKSLFAEIKDNDPALNNPAAPAGTKLGHMHLRVGNIPKARAFYHGVLGFDLVAEVPTALFLSAGGYHHHIGMNVWESEDGNPTPENSAGLREFSIALPDQAELDRLTAQIEAAGISVEREGDSALVLDPFETRIRLVLASSLNRN
jgi:catechol 2,3-dioxygenase